MARAARLVWVGGVPLAFELDWVPLLGDPEAARGKARRLGASHQAVSGDPPAALGLARGLPPDAGTWELLAALEGVALARADRGSPDPGLACEAVDALRLAHPKLELLAAAGLAEDLAGEATARRPLEPVRRRGLRLALLVLMTGLGVAGWLYRAGGADAAAAPDPDASAGWHAALDRVLAQRPLHGEAGTRALLDSLYRQPARLGGWSLHALRCQPRP